MGFITIKLTTILVQMSLVRFSPGIFPMGRNLMAHPLVNTWYSKANHGLMDGRLLKPPIFVCKGLGTIIQLKQPIQNGRLDFQVLV